MKTLITCLLFSILSTATLYAQYQNHSHDEHLGKLLASYFELKDALVNDDFDKAKVKLADFTEEVISNEEMNNHEEHAEMHAKHHSSMVAAVTLAGEAGDIMKLRDSFDEVSNNLLMAIENQGYTDSELYVQFCPMADGGNGAKWISKEKEILNPYFGAMMLRCGSLEKTIK